MTNQDTVPGCRQADRAPVRGSAACQAQALLSRRLSAYRQGRHLLLKQMAPDLGVAVSTLDAWERGERFPSARHLDRIAAYTGVPVYQLFVPLPDASPE